MHEGERRRRDGGSDRRACRRNGDEFDHVLSAPERPGQADQSAHERRTDKRLQGIARAHEGRGNERRLDCDVDERSAQPDPRPDAATQQQDRREGDSRGRPHSGGVARRYRRQQSELGRGKIHGGQQSDLSQIGDRALEGEGSRLARREIRGPSQRLLEGQKLTAHPHRAWRVPTRYPGQRGDCEPWRGHEEAPEMENCEL